MLTDSKIRAMKPRDRRYTVSDGGGLYLEVMPNGRRYLRQVYRFAGKQKTITHGEFPRMKLAEARRLREEVKGNIMRGTDPKPARATPPEGGQPGPVQPGDPETTWRAISARFVEKMVREGTADATMRRVRLQEALFNRHFGADQITGIGARKIIAACREYEDQGKLDSAQRARNFASRVFRFAIAHGDCEFDPAASARDALATYKTGGYQGVTDPRQVGELMRAIRGYGGDPVTRAGLLLSAYLFPRNREIRQMEWAHIRDEMWFCPSAAMKKNRDHLVPLPRQARAVLDGLRRLTGREQYVLQSRVSASGLLSENTFNQALRKMGFPPDVHVHHGFRTTASTTLYEAGWNGDWIERQLAHVERNKVKGAYNKALHIEGRTEMMQWYADWLDEQTPRQW